MRKQLSVPEEICLFIRLSLIRHSKKKGAFTYAEYYLINVNFWFSHDVTESQIKKLSNLLRFYFHDALEQLKTNCRTNFRFKKVLGFCDRVRLNF